MKATLPRFGFLKRNLDQLANATGRAFAVSGLAGPVPDVELHSFRDPSTLSSSTKVFTDQGLGGFSTAALTSVPFLPSETPSPSPSPTYYARFHGNISIELPPNRPDVERSGFAAWRTADPGWTLFGRASYNCEALAFLALRVKADNSRYFVNIQADSMVVTDLYQHRLFAKTPGKWETIYIPFTDFVKTHMGKVLKTQGYIPKSSITTVGLGLIDRIPGPFELCIDRIWATNNRDLDSIDGLEESVE
ncbi:CIA30-domain-containing protein [Wilcoxina mikolae CBS 423.85]|nr:CIA30-domain-containing protein [Wilcoxina mikolae CBS 423.85]